MALDGGEVDERLGVAQVSGSGHRQQQVVVEGDGTGGGGFGVGFNDIAYYSFALVVGT